MGPQLIVCVRSLCYSFVVGFVPSVTDEDLEDSDLLRPGPSIAQCHDITCMGEINAITLYGWVLWLM